MVSLPWSILLIFRFDILSLTSSNDVSSFSVAVCGLPNPNDRHALVMARFAGDCLERFGVMTSSLEKMLGPDTYELGLRIGLHSGPVTAGVLRGERARFQLFGDTGAYRFSVAHIPNPCQQKLTWTLRAHSEYRSKNGEHWPSQPNPSI